MDYDVAVVGGGAAGLSAGLLLARSLRRIVVLDAGEPRNGPAAHLHGFLGHDGRSPAELLDAGRAEVQSYGAEIVSDRVTDIAREAAGFTLRRAGGGSLSARAVLVATGLTDRLPNVDGVCEQWGRGVAHCPYCHGYEVRGSAIGVIGGDNRGFSLHQAALLRQWSEDVVFFTNRIELTEDERRRLVSRDIEVIDGRVTRLVIREGQVRGVEIADGLRVPRDQIFVGPTFEPNDSLLVGAGCVRGDDGWVRADATGATSVDGLFAAGNVVTESAQAIGAAGAGAATGIAINHYLLTQDISAAADASLTSTSAAGTAATDC